MRMKAVFDCSADEAGEISFKEGDVLVDVVESGEEGWYKGRILNTSEVGLFPYNYVVRLPDSADSPPTKTTEKLSGIDAFEAAMAPKTKLSAPSRIISDSPPPLSTKPKFTVTKNLGLEKVKSQPNHFQQETSPTRLRSYSTSSVLNKSTDTEKMLRPSQFAAKGNKSALEIALSKGTPRLPSNLRSDSFSKTSGTGGIALVGMDNLKTNSQEDVEDEDGYQMVKPSQLRQKQQLPFNKTSVSSPWKKSSDATSFLNNTPSKSTSISKLDVTSSSPMPRLPSRPVSAATRRSRGNRVASTSPSSPDTVKETEKPVLKPKPQVSSTSQPSLPPRPTKNRSTSNPPPPIQPKPAMSSIEILLSRNNKPVEPAPSKSVRNAPKKPDSASKPTKPNSIPSVPARPSLDSWRSNNSNEDVNIKPSTLLNRARSSTNPSFNSSNSIPFDWTTIKSPLSPPVSRAVPVADKVPTPLNEVPKKKTTPPPPPPSRPPKKISEKQRYEALFNSVQDQGFIDGETVHTIWVKSKLPNEDLARIWRECDPEHKGLLDKQAFVDGMSKVDELLSLKH